MYGFHCIIIWRPAGTWLPCEHPAVEMAKWPSLHFQFRTSWSWSDAHNLAQIQAGYNKYGSVTMQHNMRHRREQHSINRLTDAGRLLSHLSWRLAEIIFQVYKFGSQRLTGQAMSIHISSYTGDGPPSICSNQSNNQLNNIYLNCNCGIKYVYIRCRNNLFLLFTLCNTPLVLNAKWTWEIPPLMDTCIQITLLNKMSLKHFTLIHSSLRVP